MAATGGIGDIFSPSITQQTAISGKGVQDLTMDDFFNLLVAQMTNQDMMNPTDNTEMVAQMAQFSALQGIKNIQEYQQSAYAMSYVGRDVTIADVNDKDKMEMIKGTVESLTFYDGEPQVIVNGKAYPLHKVMEINVPVNPGSVLNQAASYIGKYVTLTDTDANGMPFDVKGIVDSVTIKGGHPYVVVNGKAYPVNVITEVQEAPPEKDPNPDDKKPNDGSGDGLDGDPEE